MLLLALVACLRSPTPVDDSGVVVPDWGPSGLTSRPPNATCHAPERPPPASSELALASVYDSLVFNGPVQVDPAPGGGLYVVEQSGRIVLAPDDPAATEATTVVTFSVATGGERGLLGFDRHPDFASNGHAYVYGTWNSPDLQGQVRRVTSTDGGVTFDLSTMVTLLSVAQPAGNHNGGQLRFGPDGYLYLALGDGGGAWDTYSNGQDPNTLLGAILRIDVDGGDPYAIPPDNPFASGGGAPEIYAWGLRNPWRFTFDRLDGTLLAADVGQGQYEEIDEIVLGGNYGWPLMEGPVCHQAGGCAALDVEPSIGGYAHQGNQNSITGGVVYRGTAIPSLTGTYLFADFYRGELQGLRRDGDAWVGRDLGLSTGGLVSSFGQDAEGEVLVVGYSGHIQRIVAADDGSPPADDTVPRLLSQTGCLDPTDPTQAVAGVLPYTPSAPFWSDGAAKTRWLALPDGTSATLAADGDLELPVGTVLIKQFDLADTPVETRLFVRHSDGGWGGYSYAWRADGSDAELLEGGATVTRHGQTWIFPSRGDCLSCHTAAAGRSLGLEAAQLHHPLDYGSGPADQLHTLVDIGVIDAPLPDDPAEQPALADPFGDAPLDDRARAWLHSNCAGCHRPEGGARTDLDLRWSTALGATGACDVAPELDDLGLSDPRIVAPGQPERSVLLARIRHAGEARMPPLGSAMVDEDGAELISSWISAVESCEPPAL